MTTSRYASVVDASALHRLIYNAKLFQVGVKADPMVLEVLGNMMRVSVDDNHTYIQDNTDLVVGDNKDWHISIAPAVAKELELYLREMHGDIDVVVVTTMTGGAELIIGGSHGYLVSVAVGPRLHSILDGTLYERDAPGPFAFSPSRFRKLSLVKPGDYPIDMIRVEHVKHGDLVLFKAGPTCVGAVTTLDREILKKKDEERMTIYCVVVVPVVEFEGGVEGTVPSSDGVR